MNIEIITTPNETLKETGFGSYLSCLAILESLQKTEHCVRLTVCENLGDLEQVKKRNPDLLFLAAKYMPIKKNTSIWFSEFFEKANLVYSGSDFKTLQFDSDKAKAKNFLNAKGIKTAKHFIAWPEQYQKELPIPFPLFIKPVNAANSCGIDSNSYANSFGAYESKVRAIYNEFDGPALVEEYLDGKEFTVAIISNTNGELIVSPVEVLPPKSNIGLKILAHAVKENNTENLLEIFDEAEYLPVYELAVSVFLALGLRGFGRIDIKTNKRGEYCFMEVNLVPGMSPNSSYFPKAFEMVNNLRFDDVIGAMLEECLHRATLKQFTRRPANSN